MGDLGKVVLTMGGNYDSTIEYERLTCVRHNTAAWVSTQTTIGNEPTLDSPYWKKMTDDGYTATVVSYDLVVEPEMWGPSEKYSEYRWQASLMIKGVTAASAVTVTFGYDEVMSSNFSPVCESEMGFVTIYARHKPEAAITIPTVTANKYYNVDEVLSESAKSAMNRDIADLHEKVVEAQDTVEKLRTTKYVLRDVEVDFTKWSRSQEIPGFAYVIDIPIEGIDDSYTAHVCFEANWALSQHFAPVVKTGTDVNTGIGYVRIYIKNDCYDSKNNKLILEGTMNVPAIVCEKMVEKQVYQPATGNDEPQEKEE